MKIMHEQVDFPGRSTIKVKWRDIPYFTYPWHFHSQFELVYVIEGAGNRYVADNIESFNNGDLVLLGTNLPHFWKSDKTINQRNPQYRVKAIIVQFPVDFFKEQIANYPEYNSIKELLNLSALGIRFLPPVSDKAGEQLHKLLKKTGFEQLSYFLELLQFLSKSKDYKLLASEVYRPDKYQYTNDRLVKVMNYLNYHYQEKLVLEEVADVAGFHPSAFCRFFKENTGKTLTGFINEMRVGYACKLLIKGYMSVSQICFECGFNNISNFNRTFKKMTKLTPSKYQMQFHEKGKF